MPPAAHRAPPHVTFARISIALLALATLTLPAIARARSASVPVGFTDDGIAGSLDEPVSLAEVPDPASVPARRVLFVEQRTARVGLVIDGAVSTLDTIPGVSALDEERGLLGVAVDPGFPARPYVYLHLTDGRAGHSVTVSRFTLGGDLAFTGTGALTLDLASRYDLLDALPDNAPNHNGGTVRFGPDRMLYVSLGDDATGCPAQDITVPVGKILRLDVSRLPEGPGGPAPIALLAPGDNPFATEPDSTARLVWTFGLRNPFRFQVDMQTGALFIADVGEFTWEELDRADRGGMNMGWPFYEGPASHLDCGFTPVAPATPPIAYYSHPTGYVAMAGPVYRLPMAGAWRFPPEYEGNCFFFDYYIGFLRRFQDMGTGWVLASPVPGQPNATDWGSSFDFVADMIELSDGTIWYCRQSDGGPLTGEIRRIRSTFAAGVADAGADRLALAPPAPSPTRGPTRLSWTQARAERVSLAIFDAQGRLVRTLVDGLARDAGSHTVTWDGTDGAGRRAGPGLYFARLRVGDAVRQARLARLE